MSHVIPSLTGVLSRFVDVATRGIVILHLEDLDDDRSLRCVHVNATEVRITGIAASSQIGELLDDIVPGLRKTGLVAAYADVIRTNCARSFGDTRYGDARVPDAIYSISAVPLGDQCVAIVLENVSERRAAETARHEMERRFTDLFEHSVDAIVITEKNAVVAANPAACALLGYNEDDLRGRGRNDIVACDDAVVQGMLRSLAETGLAFGELVLQRKDGSRFPAEISAYQYPSGTSRRNSITIRDISERSAAKALSRQSELILDSVSDGIIGIRPDGQLTFLNPAASSMLGVTQSDFTSKTIHELVHHSHADGTPFPIEECDVRKAMLHGQPLLLGQDVYWRADGTSFPVEYSAMPIRDERGHSLGAVLTFRDITQRREVERLKSEFVSTVSHELRTPLTSIHGALGLLSSGMLGAISDKAQRMLEIAAANTQRLVRLINDILDLERMESGAIAITRTEADAYSLMCKAAEGVQTIADESGMRIEVERVNAALLVDADRIVQTLTNLVSNAIKFSPRETTVTVSGRVENGRFTMRVADCGRGIPGDKRDAVFERFKQVDASDSRAKGGTGLGLAICKSIVAAHGGRIWVETNGDCGSVFLFTVPLSHVPASDPMPHATDSTAVLIVEDDLDLARVVMAALQTRSIQAVHAANGRDAIALCSKHQPLLIILDLGLPDIDGFAVVEQLRRSDSLRQTSLLIYSAKDVAPSGRERLTLGRTEFLTKSRVTMEELESAVERLLAVTPTREHQHSGSGDAPASCGS